MVAFACPKHMVYGPCGGVEADGSCEVAVEPCVFLGTPTVRWDEADASTTRTRPGTAAVDSGNRMRAVLDRGRVVVADFPATALDIEALRRSADVLRGSVHAVLAGDAPRNRVQFSPSYRAQLIRDAGLTPWMGLNCRDRNRIALEGEIGGLVAVGVGGVHCVTGDHTSIGSRADAQAVFDLDSTRLAALARRAGLLVSVAESPSSPPLRNRPGRLLEKSLAGAEVCFINHCGGVEPVASFVNAARDLGADLHYLACVPLVIDRGSAELLRSFTSLVLPDGFLERILGAADPRAEGIEAAVELAEGMLGVDGVSGVNLSGGAAPGDDLGFADALAAVGQRLGVRE